jgi:hypothetical protein
MHSPHRFFFHGPGQPSPSDKLLKASHRLKIDVCHFADCEESEEFPRLTCEVQLHGSVPLSGEKGPEGFALVSALLRQFRQLGNEGQEGGEHYAK